MTALSPTSNNIADEEGDVIVTMEKLEAEAKDVSVVSFVRIFVGNCRDVKTRSAISHCCNVWVI